MALTLADLLAAKETELRSAESARETATTRQNTIGFTSDCMSGLRNRGLSKR